MRAYLKPGTIIPFCSGALSVFWIVYGLTRHGFWDSSKGPLPGFVPVLMAALLFVVSVLGFIGSLKVKTTPDRLENWTILLAAGITFALVFLIGMIAALLVFVFVWLKFYEKTGWKNTGLILLISFGIAWGVFVLWLGVPFPRGIIIDAIAGM
ncbi:MAG: tripartite tricarboxylate transporter TctB family protein [Spirochaetales bacterium]|jgi:hypothetical protein|nr:tripartite tricarboxylate transporter TctB family protein [Spirochaetales bacterium]